MCSTLFINRQFITYLYMYLYVNLLPIRGYSRNLIFLTVHISFIWQRQHHHSKLLHDWQFGLWTLGFVVLNDYHQGRKQVLVGSYLKSHTLLINFFGLHTFVFKGKWEWNTCTAEPWFCYLCSHLDCRAVC